MAEERLDSLRQSTQALLQDAIATLAGVPGAQHALDRLMRMGISIARREDDPELRAMLGRALVHQARINAERRGTSGATLKSMRTGIELSESARDDLGGAGDPDLPHMRNDYAAALIRSGRLDLVDDVLDAALDDAARMKPTNAANHADAAAMRARVHARRASLLRTRGRFAESKTVVDGALEEIEALRVEIPALREEAEDDSSTEIHVHRDRDRDRLTFVRAALLGIEGNLRNIRSSLQFATGSIGAGVEARRAADIAAHLNASHGANLSLANDFVATQQDAAASALAEGDIEAAQAFQDRAIASLPEADGMSGADDLQAHLNSAWTGTGRALARGDDDAVIREAARMTALIEDYEDALGPSFMRDRVVATATMFLGRIAYHHGRSLDASAAIARSYQLLDDLARRSPEHFGVATERCWAALELSSLLAGDAQEGRSDSGSKWLERARAHWQELPGDRAALESLSDLNTALTTNR